MHWSTAKSCFPTMSEQCFWWAVMSLFLLCDQWPFHFLRLEICSGILNRCGYMWPRFPGPFSGHENMTKNISTNSGCTFCWSYFRGRRMGPKSVTIFLSIFRYLANEFDWPHKQKSSKQPAKNLWHVIYKSLFNCDEVIYTKQFIPVVNTFLRASTASNENHKSQHFETTVLVCSY